MRRNLNVSKPPVTITPDVHGDPRHRPGSLPVVTAGQLPIAAGAAGPDYAAGYVAGQRWAAEVATFLELERVEAADRAPFFIAPAFVRGFIDGALAVINESVFA